MLGSKAKKPKDGNDEKDPAEGDAPVDDAKDQDKGPEPEAAADGDANADDDGD